MIEFEAMGVSVIIPTYNRLWALPRAVESCLRQHESTQVIVVDDGSTDGTWEWLQQQKGVTAVRQSNQGKCWAVNMGFRMATERYVRFLDSDDWLLEGVNERQQQIAETSGADLVLGGYEVHKEGSEITESREWIQTDDLIAQFLGECDSSHYSAFLFKREFLDELPHRPDFAFRDDRLFTLEALLKHPKVAFDSELGFAHLHHTQPRLQVADGMRLVVTNYQHLELYRRILSQLEGTGELTNRRARAAVKVLWPLAHWIAYTHREEACDVANWIMSLDPGFKAPDDKLLGILYRWLGFRKTEILLSCRRSLLGLIKSPN